MPKNKRKRQSTATAERRQLIARMHLQGVTQHEIAKVIGVSQPMISQHLRAVRKEWRESALVDFNEAKSRVLAKIDEVEREAWAAWTRSKKIVNGKTTGLGDPKFLLVVDRCVQKRMDIYGLSAPLQIVGGSGSLPWLDEPPRDVIEGEVIEVESRRIEE